MARRRGSAAPQATVKSQLAGLEKAMARWGSIRPAVEVLRRVSAVPTCFAQFDHATEVGGLPIERFMLVHGPSAGGKTRFTLGLIGSFLARHHLALLVDAERTTPIDFAVATMGVHAQSPRFFAARPATFEATRAQVREFVTGVAAAREAGELPPDTSALVVVDSIRKLVPENILAKIVKETEKRGIDGMGGRAAQIKAAMNAAWMDELIPLLEDTRTAMVAIARETEDPDADQWSKKAGRNYKIGGGKALFYDASLVMRVELERYVSEKVSKDEYEDGKRGAIFGERHRVTIRKTKVAGKEDRETVSWFHTSNGLLVPEGFDRARDIVDLGKRLDVIKTSGAWLSWGRTRWQGEHAAVKRLHAEPELLAGLEEAVRGAFAAKEPLTHDADGVVGE
jgi:RecA/RadA recombinase